MGDTRVTAHRKGSVKAVPPACSSRGPAGKLKGFESTRIAILRTLLTMASLCIPVCSLGHYNLESHIKEDSGGKKASA